MILFDCQYCFSNESFTKVVYYNTSVLKNYFFNVKKALAYVYYNLLKHKFEFLRD